MNYLKIDTRTLTRQNADLAAQLMDSFARILAQETQAAHVLDFDPSNDKAPKGLAERCQCGYDHTLTAMLFLSIHTANVLEDLVDWEEWNDGVFSYEHLDAIISGQPAHMDKTLPAYLYRRITDDQWHQIIGNHQLPTVEDMQRLIRDWVRAHNLASVPLKAETERGLSKEQLRERYGIEHPTWPQDLWRLRVCDLNTQLGYWDWVIDSIATAED